MPGQRPILSGGRVYRRADRVGNLLKIPFIVGSGFNAKAASAVSPPGPDRCPRYYAEMTSVSLMVIKDPGADPWNILSDASGSVSFGPGCRHSK